MGYAVICDARDGDYYGISILGLVDRNETQSSWWTSDDTNILMNFRKRSAAEYQVDKLEENNPRVVTFEAARKRIKRQKEQISETERQDFWEQIENEVGTTHGQD